jgi:hypothetical protein
MARSKKKGGNPTPSERWQAESLRLTVFPVPESGHSIQTWWMELFDAPPDQVVTKPRSGETQIQGSVENSLFHLQADPMRVTLRRTVKPPNEPVLGDDTLGPYAVAWRDFSALVARGIALSSFPRIQRLAFGAVLCQPVSDLRVGYEILGRFLSNVRIDEDVFDFLYQINRPRPSRTIDGLRINRLSKWSMALAHGVLLRGDGAIVQTTRELSCRSELDINSDAENKNELRRENLQGLFAECAALAGEIATRGDVP